MPHIEDRIAHDADAHVMEPKDWLDPFVAKSVKSELASLLDRDFGLGRHGEVETARALQRDPEHRAKDSIEVMARKNYRAIGAFEKSDRVTAMDLIGVSSQLVFPTYFNVLLEELESGNNMDLLYGTAEATNLAQAAFCEVSDRLLPVGYVPIADLDRVDEAARQTIDSGCKALLLPWACPRHHSTSHVRLDAVWSQAVDAGLPVLFHVGVADRVLPKAHANNGLPKVQDFHGGDENFRSISYMAIPHGPMQALAMLILDGVLERFPTLKVGVIELGASWVPGFMRQLDSALEAFGRHESRLQDLSLRPSEYISRQVRVTPYPTEPAGWIIEQSGPEICMFSSDYPHLEGGRNPYGRFSSSTADLSDGVKDRFFRRNFEDLMGNAVPHDTALG